MQEKSWPIPCAILNLYVHTHTQKTRCECKLCRKTFLQPSHLTETELTLKKRHYECEEGGYPIGYPLHSSGLHQACEHTGYKCKSSGCKQCVKSLWTLSLVFDYNLPSVKNLKNIRNVGFWFVYHLPLWKNVEVHITKKSHELKGMWETL